MFPSFRLLSMKLFIWKQTTIKLTLILQVFGFYQRNYSFLKKKLLLNLLEIRNIFLFPCFQLLTIILFIRKEETTTKFTFRFLVFSSYQWNYLFEKKKMKLNFFSVPSLLSKSSLRVKQSGPPSTPVKYLTVCWSKTEKRRKYCQTMGCCRSWRSTKTEELQRRMGLTKEGT